jgi:hypothetical protein
LLGRAECPSILTERFPINYSLGGGEKEERERAPIKHLL